MGDDLFSISGRVALITGGNGGLGRAIAGGLRRFGAAVAVTGRDREKNAIVAGEFGEEFVFELDVRDELAVERVVALVVERLGGLDILVNNAGVGLGGPVTELERRDWDTVVETHLTGSFLCSKHAAPRMGGERNGKIVNIGSMYSLFGPPRFAAYAAAKAGILGLTRSLAVELAPRIQVNAILPGWFETDLTREIPQTARGEEIRRRTPAGRWGEPAELVGTAVYLASSASDFVTGASVPVDGGYSVSDRLLYE